MRNTQRLVRSIVIALLALAILTGTAVALNQFVRNVAATVVVRVITPDGIEVFLDQDLTQPANEIDFGEIEVDFFGTALERPSVRVWVENRSASTVKLSVSDDFDHGQVSKTATPNDRFDARRSDHW